jgi:regulator of protease activity HflC (stomatin/prohibitin superfamily)
MLAVLAFLGAAAPSIFASMVVGGVVGIGLFVALSAARRQRSWPLALLAAIVVTLIAFGVICFQRAYTVVEVRTVALVKRFGQLTGDVFDPGLHWRTPFIDQLEVITTRIQSYETSDSPGTSGADFTDVPVNAQTVDGQQIHIKYTLLFRMPPEAALGIAREVGSIYQVVENIVKAHSRNLTRTLAQSHTAEDLYSGEGIFTYQAEVAAALQAEFTPYGIQLEDFLVRKIEFDEEYIRAIEQQQIAQEAIETAQYQAEAAAFQRDQQIRLSEADAERTRLLAEADAERQRLLADSEAYSIQVRGEALREFPEVIQWEFVVNLVGIEWGILPSDGVTPLVPIPSFGGEETEILPTE